LTASTFKQAGVDQSLSWNTTAPIKERPILLYLFDSSKPKGKNFEASKDYEIKIFPDSKVIKLSEQFICEKTCFKNELTKSFKGREVLNAFKREYTKVPLDKRRAHVVFLNWKGEVLYSVKKVKAPGKFSQYMKLALKKNKSMLAEVNAKEEGKLSAKS